MVGDGPLSAPIVGLTTAIGLLVGLLAYVSVGGPAGVREVMAWTVGTGANILLVIVVGMAMVLRDWRAGATGGSGGPPR